MATITNHTLVDDIDGGDATQTITFAIDGRTYTIDLNDTNADKLRADLTAWTQHARRATKNTAKRNNPTEVKAARKYLKAGGYPVGDKGRIPDDLWNVWRNRNK